MQSSTLQFLRNLEKNNNREWFNENKTLYQEAQQDVISFVEKLIEEMADFDEEMGKHRALISDLDFQLIELLSSRMKISEKIGVLKKENNIAIFQPDRWKVIAEYAAARAEESGMSKEFIEKIFKAIHEESIEVQNNIMID